MSAEFSTGRGTTPWGLVLLAAAALSGAHAPAPQSAVDLLDRYAHGDFDAVVRTFAESRDPGGLRGQLQEQGSKWTRAEGEAAEPRRRLIAATVGLELANARMDDEWLDLRSLVEWGCGLLRRSSATEPERLWQLAALAVVEGALDSDVLYKFNHLAHAESRFRLEPRFKLARNFGVTGRSSSGLHFSLQAGFEPQLDDDTRVVQSDATFFVDAAIKNLQGLQYEPAIAAEAVLRAGHMQVIRLKLEAALASFQAAVKRSREPYVTYLGHFLAGRTLERMDRLDEAEQAYAQALEALPHAQSAVLGRAALLVRAGRTTEAVELTSASFAARPRPADPWRLYPYGDYYRWPTLIAQLRGEISK
jgi:tetratricopeptide (TPR) repeat protein